MEAEPVWAKQLEGEMTLGRKRIVFRCQSSGSRDLAGLGPFGRPRDGFVRDRNLPQIIAICLFCSLYRVVLQKLFAHKFGPVNISN